LGGVAQNVDEAAMELPGGGRRFEQRNLAARVGHKAIGERTANIDTRLKRHTAFCPLARPFRILGYLLRQQGEDDDRPDAELLDVAIDTRKVHPVRKHRYKERSQ
jgi:hypothetical protein